MTRISVTVFSIAAIGLLALAAVVTRQEAQKSSDDKATPVKLGVMTERQRQHSKLFTGRSVSGKKITDHVGRHIVITIGSEEGSATAGSSVSLDDLLQSRTCESDLVVVGDIIEKESQLTEDATFIFTDYTVKIQQVLKKDSFQPEAFDEVTVTRGGGRVELNGQEIEVREHEAEPLRIGHRYLLFLKRIPETGAYLPLSGSSAVSESGTLGRLSGHRYGEFPEHATYSDVVTGVTNAAARPCTAPGEKQ